MSEDWDDSTDHLETQINCWAIEDLVDKLVDIAVRQEEVANYYQRNQRGDLAQTWRTTAEGSLDIAIRLETELQNSVEVATDYCRFNLVSLSPNLSINLSVLRLNDWHWVFSFIQPEMKTVHLHAKPEAKDKPVCAVNDQLSLFGVIPEDLEPGLLMQNLEWFSGKN